MMAAATVSADLNSKICLLLRCPIGSLAERFYFLRCFSFSSNAIFSGVLVKILVFPDRDGLDVFRGAAFAKEERQLEKYMDWRKILLLEDQLCLNQHRKKLSCQSGAINQGL